MLASLSQLAQDYGKDITETIRLIKDDLSDNKMLDDTGGAILDALAEFCDPSNPYNKTNVDDAAETPLDKTISGMIDTPVILPSEASDLAKAKALIADLRNTALSIYDYKGVGTPGIVETPFKNLSDEMATRIEPELTLTADRLEWIIQSSESGTGHYL